MLKHQLDQAAIININMTPEERVNEYYWWVLGRIKEQLDTSPSNKPVRYELGHVGAAGVPNNETEENIIRKLEELNALRIINEFPRESDYSSRHIFELKVIQPNFDEIYHKYKGLCDPSSQADYKIVVKNLSSNSKKVLSEIIEKLEGQAETTPTGQSIYFESASYRSDGINEKSLIDKLEEWGLLTVEGEDEEYGHPVVSVFLDKLKTFKRVLDEEYSVHNRVSGATSAGSMPEDLEKAVRWILQKINKEYIAAPAGEQIFFKFVIGEVIIMGRPKTVPSYENQQLALKVLDKEKAIKISEYVYTSRMTGQYSVAAGSSKLTGARMTVLQPKFDGFYKKFMQSPTYESAKQEEQSQNYLSAKNGTNENVPDTYSQKAEWSDDFKWQGDTFIFGNYGKIDFSSKDRKYLFQKLTDAKGQWVKVNDLKGGKDNSYARATIKQIEDRLEPGLKRHISIPSTQDDNLEPKPTQQGAYRIKFLSKPPSS